jgi:acyl-CoA dehydrogenase
LRLADGPDEVHLQSIARMELKAQPYGPGKENPYLTASV